ncbi:hypothetical protein [Thiomonas sp.]
MGSEKVRDVSGSGLISLIDNIKSEPTGLTKTIRRNFDLIAEAREIGAGWGEIIKALDREWSEKIVRTAYSKERRRREKEGVKAGRQAIKAEAVPEKTERKENVPEKKPGILKEEKKGLPGPPQAAPTGGVVTGSKTPDPKEAEASGSRWPEIKY